MSDIGNLLEQFEAENLRLKANNPAPTYHRWLPLMFVVACAAGYVFGILTAPVHSQPQNVMWDDCSRYKNLDDSTETVCWRREK